MENMVDYTLMRYGRDSDIPVFIRFFANNHLPDLLNFLVGLKFELVGKDQIPEIQKQIEQNPHARVLELGPCGAQVARHLFEFSESDRFGAESVRKENGMRFYRYRGEAMMLYSFTHKEWRLGCFENFGVDKNKIHAHRTVIARFLSLALMPMGIIGFWGSLMKDGVMVTRQKDCEGEMVFFDLFRQRVYGLDGSASIHKHPHIYRVDSTYQGANKKMTSEELYAFLALHTTWLDADGTNASWRQAAQRLAILCKGIITSKETIASLDLPS
jgi:hypothetical protein